MARPPSVLAPRIAHVPMVLSTAPRASHAQPLCGWRRGGHPGSLAELAPDRLDRRDDLRQRIRIPGDDSTRLTPNQARRGVGIVVQPCLVSLIQEPWQLRERARVALDDLVLRHRVATLLHPHPHPLNIALG